MSCRESDDFDGLALPLVFVCLPDDKLDRAVYALAVQLHISIEIIRGIPTSPDNWCALGKKIRNKYVFMSHALSTRDHMERGLPFFVGCVVQCHVETSESTTSTLSMGCVSVHFFPRDTDSWASSIIKQMMAMRIERAPRLARIREAFPDTVWAAYNKGARDYAAGKQSADRDMYAHLCSDDKTDANLAMGACYLRLIDVNAEKVVAERKQYDADAGYVRKDPFV